MVSVFSDKTKTEKAFHPEVGYVIQKLFSKVRKSGQRHEMSWDADSVQSRLLSTKTDRGRRTFILEDWTAEDGRSFSLDRPPIATAAAEEDTNPVWAISTKQG